jgi:hypothetical protein
LHTADRAEAEAHLRDLESRLTDQHTQATTRFLTSEEIAKLMGLVRGSAVEGLVTLSLMTGMRVNELRDLTVAKLRDALDDQG